MLVLTFQVDRIPYAIPVGQVIEVVPRVELRRVPHAPPCLLGLLHYRGSAIPVIDLGLLLGGTACRDRLDTRILLVRTTRGGGEDDRLGLVAERVNEIIDIDAAHTAMQTPRMLAAPYLAAVYETESGLLQLIDPRRISVTVTEGQGAITP